MGKVRPIPFPNPNTAEQRMLREERERQAILDAAAIDKLVATERLFAREQGLTDGYARGWRWGLAFGVMLGCALTYVVL